jgi:hypothetical protein
MSQKIDDVLEVLAAIRLGYRSDQPDSLRDSRYLVPSAPEGSDRRGLMINYKTRITRAPTDAPHAACRRFLFRQSSDRRRLAD